VFCRHSSSVVFANVAFYNNTTLIHGNGRAIGCINMSQITFGDNSIVTFDKNKADSRRSCLCL